MFEGVARLWPEVAGAPAVQRSQPKRRDGARISLLLFLLATCSVAQVPVEGAIHGTAADAAARAVAGAEVRADDRSRGLLFRSHCDSGGSFSLAHLPAGSYRVTIAAPGFATVSVGQVVVEAGGAAQLSVVLKPEGRREIVNVVDDEDAGIAGVEQASGSAVSNVIGTREIESLPVDGRRWQNFALLSPAINAGDMGSGAPLISARGLAVTQNASTLDGAVDDDSFHGVTRGSQNAEAETVREESANDAGIEPGGARRSAGSWRRSGAAYTFSQEAIREFRVSTQNYTAQYGHGAGATIATISKSGSNALHGSLFYIARNSGLNAANPFSIATRYNNGAIASAVMKPHDLRQQSGGTVGGPLVHDRLFYFYAFDQQRRGFDGISSPGDPNFYSLTATQRALLANRGVTGVKIHAALNYLDSLSGTVHRRDDQTINFLKLDWQATAKHRFSVQYNRLRSSLPGALRGAAVVDRGVVSLGSGETRLDSTSARWNWSITPRINNEVRFAWGRDLQFEQAQTPLPQEPAIGIGGLVPEIAIAEDGFSFGTPAGVGRRAYPDERRTQLSDTFSVALGRHLLQAGVEFSAVRDTVSALDNTVGTFRYDSGVTNGRAGGLVDWITDYTFNVRAYPNGACPSINAAVHLFCFRSYTQSFGEETVAWSTQEWAGFVEESWRPRSNLKIDAGVRYEYLLLPLPQHPNAVLDAIFGERGATSIFPEDRNNFGPRLGIAWSPFGEGHGVVRAAYGIYYGRVPGATVRAALTNTAQAASSTHIRFTPSTITTCPQVANQGFGYVCSYLSAPPQAIASTTSATVFSRRFRSPLVQQGVLAMERGIGKGVVFSATYLMNIDRQLPGSVDLNIAPSTATEAFQIVGGVGVPGVRNGDRFVVPLYTSRINDSLGTVTAMTSNVGASYNALAIEARRRARAGLELRAAWTWSKAIDQAQTAGATPGLNTQFDPYAIGYDKGLSRLNYPAKLAVSAVWSPRVRSADRLLRALGDGWTTSGIFYATSGRPYSYEIFGGSQLAGGRDSINGSGGAVYLPTVGRNTLRLPMTERLDLRLSRVANLGEHLRVRGAFEAFNILNRVNYTGVQQRAFLVGQASLGVTPLIFQDAATIASEGLNTRPFGRYTDAGEGSAGERRLQITVRLEF